MENETDLIREQMRETRTALSEKLEALQEQVLGTVEGTTRSVTETVEAVQEAVQGTVNSVTESVQDTVETVKHTFDLSGQVQKHPWLMVGGAVVVGYLGGRLLAGPSYEALPPPSDGSAPTRTNLTSGPSWFEGVAGPLLKQVEGLALGALAGVAADLVAEHAPEALRGQLNDMVSQFTDSIGTKPLRGLLSADKAGDGKPAGQTTGMPRGMSSPGSPI